nr:MAG TPA: hypothetical protein [Caudoviricetes sp.]
MYREDTRASMIKLSHRKPLRKAVQNWQIPSQNMLRRK